MDKGGIKTALIADDNADAGDTLGAFFQVLGIETTIVRDGQAAVEAVARSMPDLAILDLGMPRLDGWEACKQIRAMSGGDAVRLIALSGWGTQDARERSAAAGFGAHWTKPAEASTLLGLLMQKQD